MPTGIYKRTEKHKNTLGKHWKIKDTSKMSHPAWNKGVNIRLNTGRTLFRIGVEESKSHNWKGDKVGYHGLHMWVRKHLGKPKQCEHCGLLGEKIGKNWNIHWANKSHKYLRDLTDWTGLCARCHMIYDKNYPYLNNLNVHSTI